MAASTTRAPRRPAPAFGFGDRLRVVRRELRLTQAEMAERVGAGLKQYSAWESGASKPADLIARAEILESATGISRAWWLGWGDPVPLADAAGAEGIGLTTEIGAAPTTTRDGRPAHSGYQRRATLRARRTRASRLQVIGA